jgi:hypothetical protein
MISMKIFLLLIFFYADLASAQEHLHLKYKNDISISYNYGYDNNLSDINSINDIPLCCESIKTGNSIIRGGMLSWRYSPYFYSQFVLSIGIIDSETYYSEFEEEDINVNGSLFPGIFNHNLTIESQKAMLAGGYEYNVWKKLFIGTSLALFYNHSQFYNYKEELVIPSDKGIFKDTGTRTRNKMSGEDENNINAGISLNFYYLFALNSSHSLYFSPEIRLSAGTSKILNNYTEYNFGYSIGINIHKKLSIREIFKN